MKAGWLLLLAAAAFAGTPALPEGPGKAMVETACVRCHSLDVVIAQPRSNQGWRDTVNAMIARGAEIKRSDADVLAGYLSRHFGTEARARGLFEDICSSCHSLERVAKRSLTRQGWSQFIKGMISEGNPVNDEEFGLIVDYLAEHYGDTDKP
jgi:hypothetical protein